MHINATYIVADSQVIGGRVGIVTGLLAFACVYFLLLTQLGWIAGIAIGWLPAALAGWLVALGADTVATNLLRGSTALQSATPEN
jgi:hypothetical protein